MSHLSGQRRGGPHHHGPPASRQARSSASGLHTGHALHQGCHPVLLETAATAVE